MRIVHRILAFPFFFIGGLVGFMTFFVVEGFKIGYNHYNIKGF